MRLPSILLAVAAVVLAACTKVTTQVSSGNSWTHHGVLRWADNGEPDTLLPEIGNSQTDIDLSMFWAGYLFNWNDRNEFEPELATQVPTLENGGIGKDGLSITYHLRKGVKWQDGSPFSADDVIFSYQQIMNPANFITSRTGYELVTGIDRRDDYTIVVHLKKKYAPFVASFFTMSATPFCVLPRHVLAPWVAQHGNLNRAPFNNKPVGTGPFIVEKWVHGTSITMVANRRYWRGPPKLREIEYLYVPADTTILTMWQSHQIDFQYLVPSEELAALGSTKGIRVYKTPFTQYAEVALNSQSSILGDVRVRRALAFATNVPALLGDVSHGVPGDSDQPSFSWAHGSHNARYPFDPKRAAALLDAAGWRLGNDGLRYKNGLPLSLTLAGFGGSATSEHTQELLQAQWREAGVDVRIKDYPASLLLADYGSGGIIQNGKFDVAYSAIANGVDPDDSWLWMCDQWPPRGQNVYRYCNRALDRWENIALTSYDRTRRKVAYDRIQRILTTDEPTIILWYSRRNDVANSDLTGYTPAHAVTTFWNTWEWQI